MTANNPSLVAVSKALAHFPELRREDVRVLSIGAGSKSNAFESLNQPGSSGNWGWWQWAPHAIQLLMDSSSLSTDLLAGLMLRRKKQYHRLELELGHDIFYEDEDAGVGGEERLAGKESRSGGRRRPRKATQRLVNWAMDDVASMPVCVKLAEEMDLGPTAAFVEQMVENRRAHEQVANESAMVTAIVEEAQQQQQQQQQIPVSSLPHEHELAALSEQQQKLAALTVEAYRRSIHPLKRSDDSIRNASKDQELTEQLLYEGETGVRYDQQIDTVELAWEKFARDNYIAKQRSGPTK